ncbi:hypothetical protein DM01DRAFT_338917 [Hesseltinella vesiculosa]|uniref:Uncharacterized protein n=1 Tax=Hesseltinella vesiculosa TaxID=101127 RepID=A0A1X2G3F0_9FUNG|nr:hypothetical protein DM01DRAFT_338917 [Hesseltinella vesiculosa]
MAISNGNAQQVANGVYNQNLQMEALRPEAREDRTVETPEAAERAEAREAARTSSIDTNASTNLYPSNLLDLDRWQCFLPVVFAFICFHKTLTICENTLLTLKELKEEHKHALRLKNSQSAPTIDTLVDPIIIRLNESKHASIVASEGPQSQPSSPHR